MALDASQDKDPALDHPETLSQVEREALTDAVSRCIDAELARSGAREAERGETVSHDFTEEAAFRAGRVFEAALAAREEPKATELGDAVRKVCNEWVQENGFGPTSDWHVTRLLPLADRIDAALATREDTERPPERFEETHQ